MKLSRAASYALHAVAYMASRENANPIASHLIARERGISEKFLLKVLKPLVSAQLLRSVKGPNGGYRLARPAHEITVLDILEAVEGRIQAVVPTNGLKSALNRKLEVICHQLADQQRKHLASLKISDLPGRD